MRSFFSGLRVRILLIIAVTMIPAFVILLFMADEEKKLAIQHSREEAFGLIHSVSKEQEHNINETRRLLAGLASNEQIRSGNYIASKGALDAFIKHYPNHLSISLVDTDGYIIYTTPGGHNWFNQSGQQHFRKTMDSLQFTVGTYQTDMISGKSSIPLSFPVLSEPGHIQSVLVVNLDLDKLSEQLSEAPMPRDSCLALWDQNGTIIAHYPDPEKHVGKTAEGNDIWDAIVGGNDKDMVEATDPQGTTRFFAFKKLRNDMGAGHLHLSVGISKETVLASVNRIMYRTYLIIGMIALLMIITALTGVNGLILHGFNSLLSTTKELAQGKMNARTNIPHGAGELGELARAFDNMAEIIENREQELKFAYSDLDQIFQATSDGLCVIDKDFNIRRINKSFAKITGRDAREFVGKKCYEVLHKPICNTPNCMMIRVLEDENEANYNHDKVLEDGSVVFHMITATPYCDTDGNVVGILEHLKDVTERKKFEAEMVRYECLSLVGEMGAGIGHEIRNPLTTVRGLLQLLSTKKKYNDHLHYFDLMLSEIDRVNSILSEFLSITKNTPTRLKVQDLNSIIETMYPLIESDAKIKGKMINLDLGALPDIPLDNRQIRQLILNLVRNGLEAMPKGGALTIRTYTCEDVVLEVKDRGCGIDTKSLTKLGTPFFTTKEKGTGLGLAISYNIADNHDAKINVKSNETGTSFYVHFRKPR